MKRLTEETQHKKIALILKKLELAAEGSFWVCKYNIGSADILLERILILLCG